MKPNMKSLADFEANQKWLQAHYRVVLDEYKNQFVAVLHRKIIDADKNIDVLRDRIHRNVPAAKGIYIEFVTTEPLEMIL